VARSRPDDRHADGGDRAAAPAGSDDEGRLDHRVYDFAGEVVTTDSGATTAEPRVARPRPTRTARRDPPAHGRDRRVSEGRDRARSGRVRDRGERRDRRRHVNGPGTDETHACVTAAVKGLTFAADPGGIDGGTIRSRQGRVTPSRHAFVAESMFHRRRAPT
jgi:hypothetical protein